MYNKLFTCILDSTIWLLPDTTRIVWITLLAAMDQDGFARFPSVANLAYRAHVSIDAAEEAVKALESPDPHGPDQPHEGRRIERVPYGWMVLNGPKYRDMANAVVARERNRLRVADHRARSKGDAMDRNGVKRSVTKSAPSEAEAEAETEAHASHASAPTCAAKPPSRSRKRTPDPIGWSIETGWTGIGDADRDAWAVAYPACDLSREMAAADQWLRANPAKARKSLWRKFLTNWLSRAQERGGSAPSNRIAQQTTLDRNLAIIDRVFDERQNGVHQ